MKTQSKKKLSLVTDTNREYGPSYARGLEAVEMAATFALSVIQNGKYVDEKYTSQPNLTAEEARAALENKTVQPDDLRCLAFVYREHTIILDGEEPRILDGENEVVGYLSPQDNARSSALFIDGLLRGQEEGTSMGRAVARQEISALAGLFLGPLVQPIADAIREASK